MKKVILFCQAPGELNNLLSSYEQFKNEDSSITIVCLKLDSLKKFLDKLNLNARIVHFPEAPISLKNPLKWFDKRKITKNNLSKIDTKDNFVVFNSKFDLQLACYLHGFDKSNTIIYKRCRDNIAMARESKKNIGIVYKLKAFFLSIYTKSKIEYVKRESRYCEVIEIDRYPIDITDYIVDESLYEKYYIKLPNDYENAVIFFSEPFQDCFQTKQEYDDLNIKIVHQLKEMKYSVVVKGHPRKGVHLDVEKIVDHIIPGYIPSEFIDLKSFRFAVNFFSTALCSASFIIPAYSLIGMYEIRDLDTYNYWKEYIGESSNNQVKIIESFEELPKV
jgi:hypothetical protein